MSLEAIELRRIHWDGKPVSLEKPSVLVGFIPDTNTSLTLNLPAGLTIQKPKTLQSKHANRQIYALHVIAYGGVVPLYDTEVYIGWRKHMFLGDMVRQQTRVLWIETDTQSQRPTVGVVTFRRQDVYMVNGAAVDVCAGSQVVIFDNPDGRSVVDVTEEGVRRLTYPDVAAVQIGFDPLAPKQFVADVIARINIITAQ